MLWRFSRKKLGDRNADDRRNYLQGAERDISLTTLNRANIGAV